MRRCSASAEKQMQCGENANGVDVDGYGAAEIPEGSREGHGENVTCGVAKQDRFEAVARVEDSKPEAEDSIQCRARDNQGGALPA